MVKKILSLSHSKHKNYLKDKNFNNSVKKYDLNHISTEMPEYVENYQNMLETNTQNVEILLKHVFCYQKI